MFRQLAIIIGCLAVGEFIVWLRDNDTVKHSGNVVTHIPIKSKGNKTGMGGDHLQLPCKKHGILLRTTWRGAHALL